VSSSLPQCQQWVSLAMTSVSSFLGIAMHLVYSHQNGIV
jgi:hypothetical protein